MYLSIPHAKSFSLSFVRSMWSLKSSAVPCQSGRQNLISHRLPLILYADVSRKEMPPLISQPQKTARRQPSGGSVFMCVSSSVILKDKLHMPNSSALWITHQDTWHSAARKKANQKKRLATCINVNVHTRRMCVQASPSSSYSRTAYCIPFTSSCLWLDSDKCLVLSQCEDVNNGWSTSCAGPQQRHCMMDTDTRRDMAGAAGVSVSHLPPVFFNSIFHVMPCCQDKSVILFQK